MSSIINLNLYKGKGVPVSQRGETLPSCHFETESPQNYDAEDGLRNAVNVAIALGQPLLITGEPGTGNYRKFLFMERFT
ncbi:MAG: hypothetical protein OMM_11733 [Candidatus Magnetoglobus multicellularis str. Araruama]|uniref:Uncharacterized protein n=1 Tax=Candidatus Magnetoglobus multicellularis str. Araruama TaxID=890399 RepID=A0A1V1NXP3_9BACT|nr:MAG: hypothetical protein OMM_11733 [Candidatus Magnetoglobus multicellularis str. Araruama]